MKDQLGYDITLVVKYVEIWETNPAHYILDNTMAKSRTSACKNITGDSSKPDFDLIVLHTGQNDTGTSVKGRAVVGSVCANNKCAAERTGLFQVLILLHEVGHVLGMTHSGNSKCNGSTETGLMDSSSLVFTTCNKVTLHATISSGKDCLYQENVNITGQQNTSTNVYANAVFNDKLPGQQYTADQICGLLVGEGGFYREHPKEREICKQHKCIHEYNGVYVVYGELQPTLGKYCGDQKLCVKIGDICEYISNTSVSHKEVVQGGWSDFGPWSGCTRTCGTGVQYRKRDCTNPVPINAPFCGSTRDQYEMHLCNIQACSSESNDTAVLVADRMTAVCAAIGDTVRDGYTRETEGHGQCEVKCTYETALLPSGTPCGDADDNEYCIEGYCEAFETVWTETVDTTTIPGEGQKAKLLEFPAGSKDISLHFSWNDMNNNYLELRAGGTVVFNHNNQIMNAVLNPINFAGTFWYFDKKDNGVQYLKMEEGTSLTQPAAVWLHQKKDQTNSGITISFARKLDGLCAEISCQNNGIWNATRCSCDCLDGYYGHTCSSQCNKYCFNGVVINETTCTCPCDTDKMYEDKCLCQDPFTGKNCLQCKEPSHSLINNCRIDCKVGCGGLTCTDLCEDKSGVDCEQRKTDDKCTQAKTERQCQSTCSYCTPSNATVTCP